MSPEDSTTLTDLGTCSGSSRDQSGFWCLKICCLFPISVWILASENLISSQLFLCLVSQRLVSFTKHE
jgi:hypothetical protein